MMNLVPLDMPVMLTDLLVQEADRGSTYPWIVSSSVRIGTQDPGAAPDARQLWPALSICGSPRAAVFQKPELPSSRASSGSSAARSAVRCHWRRRTG